MQNRIKFIHNVHKYFKGDTEYISVTTLKSKYKKPFNGKFWSLYKAFQRYLGIEDNREFSSFLWETFRYQGKHQDYDHLYNIVITYSDSILNIAQKILQEWSDYKDYRGMIGSNYHTYKEHKAYHNGYDRIGDKIGKTQGVYSYDLSELKDGFYAELLVYLDDIYFNDKLIAAGIAGQVDKSLFETVGNTRWVDIDDYKTCAKITTENKYQKMLYPLNQLDECHLSDFTFQLNMYGMILEEHGYKVRQLRFTHCIIDEKTQRCIDEIPYNLPIMTELMKETVEDYRKHNPLILK